MTEKERRPEIALTLVHPHCPVCGSPAMFTKRFHERPTAIEALEPVECSNYGLCDWHGQSPRLSVPVILNSGER